MISAYDQAITSIQQCSATQIPALLAKVVEQANSLGVFKPKELIKFATNVDNACKSGNLPTSLTDPYPGKWIISPVVADDGVTLDGFQVVWSHVGDNQSRKIKYTFRPDMFGTLANCLHEAEKMVKSPN